MLSSSMYVHVTQSSYQVNSALNVLHITLILCTLLRNILETNFWKSNNPHHSYWPIMKSLVSLWSILINCTMRNVELYTIYIKIWTKTVLIFGINLNTADCILILALRISLIYHVHQSDIVTNLYHYHPNKDLYILVSGIIRFIDILFEIVHCTT